MGSIAFLSAIIALSSNNPRLREKTHSKIFTPILELEKHNPHEGVTAGIHIAGALLETPMNMREFCPKLQKWDDPEEGLQDTLRHLPNLNPDYESLTQITTTSFIEMWANSIVNPSSPQLHPDYIGKIALQMLLIKPRCMAEGRHNTA